jgi:hypothetical protein
MCQRENCPFSNLKKVVNLLKETAKIETGMAEKSSWDLANKRQKHGLVCINRKKIIKDNFYLPVLLLIILIIVTVT